MRLIDHILPKAESFEGFAPSPRELPRTALPFLWMFARGFRIPIATVLLCYLIGAVSFMLEPYLIGRIVDAVATSTADAVWQKAGLLVLLYIVIPQVIGRAVYQIGHVVVTYMMPVLTGVVRRRLAQYLFTHGYRYFQDDYAGRLAGKVVEMPQAVHELIETLLDSGMFLVTNFIAAAILFATIQWYFAIPVALLFVATFSLCQWRVPKLYAKSEIASASLQAMRGRYLDSVTNILVVKLFGRERHEDRLFSTATVEASAAAQMQGAEEVYLWRFQHVINAVFQVGILLMAINAYHAGNITVGQASSAVAMGITLVSSLWWMLRTSITLFTKIASIEDALATIVVPTEVQDVPSPRVLSAGSGVVFDNVTFSYPGRPVFSDFSLDIPQGQRVGLVGPSGAGKSTLVQLALRLFDVTGGAIRIGGEDIAGVAQADLRHAIAVIPQATDLMHRSIRDNISYGRLDATEKEIVDAAKKAYIHDTILGLKDSQDNAGYDSMVGERGVKLSGGQRQRIAIARAFLKNAPILILDEATSALDSESERLIQESLDELFKGRTVIAIAHRLSTIAHLDRVVVMEEGRIVEDGPHATLVNGGGLYARLWRLQSAGFIGG